MGGTGWSVPGTSLSYFSSFLWVCNYFKIKSKHILKSFLLWEDKSSLCGASGFKSMNSHRCLEAEAWVLAVFSCLCPGRRKPLFCSPINIICCRFSRFWLFATVWTIARQTPLSMGFSRQEYWRGLPCPPPRDPPDSGIEPTYFMSPALEDGFFTTSSITCSHNCAGWWTSANQPGEL